MVRGVGKTLQVPHAHTAALVLHSNPMLVLHSNLAQLS